MELNSSDAAQRPEGEILIVEDEAIIREFVSEILELEGFKTRTLESADLAKDYLEQHSENVALLLTDILMPGSLNGATLANLSHRQWPNIPVMIMSGHETPESSGVEYPVEFIRKPWTMGQLITGVERALTTQRSLLD